MNKKLFSLEKTQTHDNYRIFGIKLSLLNKHFKRECEASKIIQNSLDLSQLTNSKKVIVFLTPPRTKINGGVMSIFSLCEGARNIVKNAYCCLATYPGKETYVINDKFLNYEKIIRFEQIVKNAKNVQELILHIPDYYSSCFYKDLNKKEISFLKSIPNLQINILNQNIEQMPEPKKLQDLYKLTKNITQTLAHNRYANQEVCNKYQIPTHLFSVNIDLTKYKTYSFEDKEKIVVLSPDTNEYKDKIVNKLKQELPDWNFVTVNNMTFSQYMDLVSRAYFTITFGEGMDGYLIQPHYVGSVGFAVYNDEFFPNKEWSDLKNIYSSYDEMFENIANDIKNIHSNKELYNQANSELLIKNKKLYNIEGFNDNLTRFYEKKYDFIPINEDKK